MPEAPVPSAELRKGVMVKLGNSFKTWKTRYFVAFNEADNYRIDYYDKEGGALRKSVELCGYRPHKFTADEAKRHSTEFGIKLVPWDDRRRVWYFKCADVKDRDAWMSVFETGCYRSNPPVDKDPVIAAAFKAAYTATRWNYGYYGWYSICGTEGETLGAFVCDILNRELLNDVYSGITENPGKSMIVSLIRATADAAVLGAVGSAWTAAVAGCGPARVSLEGAVKAAVSPLIDAQKKVQTDISEKISSKLNPFVADLGP